MLFRSSRALCVRSTTNILANSLQNTSTSSTHTCFSTETAATETELASKHGIGTWQYNAPYEKPFVFTHPEVLEVPESIVPPRVEEDLLEEEEYDFSSEEQAVAEEGEQDDVEQEQEDDEVVDEEEEVPEEDDRIVQEGHGDTFAVVDINKRQFKVSEGALVISDRLGVEVGTELVFDHLLLVANPETTIIGRPLVKGRVTAVVEAHDKTAKIIVFKKKRRKGYARQKYHTSLLTLLRITDIEYSAEAPESPVIEEVVETGYGDEPYYPTEFPRKKTTQEKSQWRRAKKKMKKHDSRTKLPGVLKRPRNDGVEGDWM